MTTRTLGDFTRFSALAAAIFRQEGTLTKDGEWNHSALGYRLNNPGNMIYAGQPGSRPEKLRDPKMAADQTYAAFDTLASGVAATERQLALDADRGLTLRQRLTGTDGHAAWATGNKAEYLKDVCEWLGVVPEASIASLASLPRVNFPELPPYEKKV